MVFNVGASISPCSTAARIRAAASAGASSPGSSRPARPARYRYTRRGEIIRCPWHGWEYDLRTGQSWCDPVRLRVKNYPATTMPGTELVEGPYTAETFEVAVEDDYVVVEV